MNRRRVGVARREGWIMALAVAVLAACGGVANPLGRAPDLPGAPGEVLTRPSLPFCGAETVERPGGDFDEAARRCFWEANVAGRPAEFITSQPTIEGDPVTWIYRLLPEGRVEVFIDQTRDRWSGMTWVRLDCERLEPIAESPVEPDFGPADCEETPIF